MIWLASSQKQLTWLEHLSLGLHLVFQDLFNQCPGPFTLPDGYTKLYAERWGGGVNLPSRIFLLGPSITNNLSLAKLSNQFSGLMDLRRWSQAVFRSCEGVVFLKSANLYFLSLGRNERQFLFRSTFPRVTIIKLFISVGWNIFLLFKYLIVLFMFIVSFMPLW